MSPPLPPPPAHVPTLTDVVAAADVAVEQQLQRLQADLAAHLATRLHEQVPLWAAQWAQGLDPQLKRLAQAMLHPRAMPAADRPLDGPDQEKPWF